MHIPFTNYSVSPAKELVSLLRDLTQTLSSLIIAALMIFGVIAIVNATISNHGWLQSLATRLLALYVDGNYVTMIAVAVVGTFGVRHLYVAVSNERIAAVLTYTFLGVGTYSAAKFLITGTL
jgi:hypothetical protein